VRKCSCHAHNGFVLSPAGLAQQTSLEGLAPRGEFVYVDKVSSVSALAEAEALHVFDHELIDQQYRRFIHGS